MLAARAGAKRKGPPLKYIGTNGCKLLSRSAIKQATQIWLLQCKPRCKRFDGLFDPLSLLEK
jgi:hypothetical protein